MATPTGLLVSGLLLLSGHQTASAAVGCGNITGVPAFNGTMALNINSLSAPRDAPVGTVLYVQEFHQAGQGPTWQCGIENAAMTGNYSVTGLGRKVDFNSGTYAGKVYDTGVPGIGVSWFSGAIGVRAVGAEVVAGVTPNGCGRVGNNICQTLPIKFLTNAAVVLIKTGPVGTGTVRGSELGRMVLSTSVADSPAYSTAAVGVTGTINVVAMTCTTPNVTVPLGSHKTSTLTGVGSGSPRVDFILNITDCPGFPGYFGNTAASYPAASQSSVTSTGTRVPNTVSLRVDPVYAAIDAPNGVLGLTPGTGVATGVGVQILYATGSLLPLSQARPLGTAFTASTRSFSIGLSARYLQTASTVTPGSANAVATYTLIYQ
ncbi:hypothetical protein BFW87_25350 [Pseudomonas fluorescens]|uniref:Fimbrial-type adhesion domain-containing protein n=2 Tax=Pseudomonas fluorescens TaxID=294 RepID=A0A1T2Y2Q8_PSEFL|nr:hypothetical protein BFW87_25350 [Pseudomonas fluorescens]